MGVAEDGRAGEDGEAVRAGAGMGEGRCERRWVVIGRCGIGIGEMRGGQRYGRYYLRIKWFVGWCIIIILCAQDAHGFGVR